MNDSTENILPPARAKILPGAPEHTVGWRNFLTAVIALTAAFSVPLYQLVRFALQSELFSHVLLVPFISAYLVWLKRGVLPPFSRPDHRLAVLPFVAGGALLVIRFTSSLEAEDALAFTTLAFVLLFVGICTLFLGRQTLRALAFPLCFLVFMAPFPTAVTDWIEIALQKWSASVAYLFFKVGGTTVFREANFFQLPGMKLIVAQECSGIHSTLALFITSLLAGHFFLRSPWKRAALALVVIPLALLRNGFRVFVIGELCVRIGPQMIDSYIHRHGGPIFFALSLIPFFLILWLLRKSERLPSESASATP